MARQLCGIVALVLLQPLGADDFPDVEVGGIASDSTCDGLWYDCLAEITAFLEGRQDAPNPLLIIETYYPKLGKERPPKGCILGTVAIDLFVHLVNCKFLDGSLGGGNSPMRCGADEPGPTMLDMNWIFDILLYGAWDMLIMSRWRVIFRLLALVHEYWKGRKAPADCGKAEYELAARLDGHTPGAAAAFLLSNVLDKAGGGVELKGWLTGANSVNPCTIHAVTVSWLKLAVDGNGKRELRRGTVITPCAGLVLAQWALREYHENATTGMWVTEQPGRALLDSTWPLFAYLDHAALDCKDRATLGNVAGRTTMDLDFILQGGDAQGAEPELPEDGVLAPFRPRFTAEARERFLVAHQLLHEVLTFVGVPYTLLRGPLLGVARHQAPLPWENDGDVCVPRARYDELLVLALSQSIEAEPSDSALYRCGRSQRCSELADAAWTVLRPRGVRLLMSLNALRGAPKFIFYMREDAATLLSDERTLHDPVIDIYLCDDWPGEGNWAPALDEDGNVVSQSFSEAGGVEFPVEWLFPLRRVYFGGLSMWAYRDPHRVLSSRYGDSWMQTCRLPSRLHRLPGEDKQTAWPKSVPCSQMQDAYAFAERVPLSRLPEVEHLPQRLGRWLCSAAGSLLHSFCDSSVNWYNGEVVGVTDASLLRAPRKAVAAAAPGSLQLLLDVDVRPDPRLACELVLRLVPLGAAAPTLEPLNFDYLWFSPPPLHRRVLVKLRWPQGDAGASGEDHLGLGSEALMEVFSAVCWRAPLQPQSRPVWDLDPPDYGMEAMAAAAARHVQHEV